MIVEELIGRLHLQTKGIKDARDAVKVLADFRKALKGMAEKSRTNFDGPAKMAKAFREAQAAQRKFAAGGDMTKYIATLTQVEKILNYAVKLREAVEGIYDTFHTSFGLAKLSPPLRSEDDRRAIVGRVHDPGREDRQARHLQARGQGRAPVLGRLAGEEAARHVGH